MNAMEVWAYWKEHPDAIFKDENDNETKFDGENVIQTNINPHFINAKWTLVDDRHENKWVKVSFKKAVKYLNKGYDIKSMNEDNVHGSIYKNIILRDHHGLPISVNEILNFNWYVRIPKET